MPDIFISYSRRDGDFGRKLHETFVGQKKDIWMDWEDIPLTADWWTEIRRGIETSDNFVLIMSPDSIGSPVCQLEIEYARRLNKRIVPIFHRDPQFEESTLAVIERTKTDEHLRRMMDGTDAAALMEANKKILATLNWVFFKPEDNFEEKFHQLSQIVDADLTHIRQHTRIQVKALEWAESGKNISFALSGDELIAAETWLAASADKAPVATDLHREFIAASRKTENARRRLLRGLQIASVVAGIFIALAFGMAVFAVSQAQDANQRAAYALTQVAAAATSQNNAELQVTIAFDAQSTAISYANIAGTAQEESVQQAKTAVAAQSISDKSAQDSATQVAVIGATLTPIAPTLTAVAVQVVEAEAYAAARRLSGEAIAQIQDTTADARTAALLAIRSLQNEYTGLADNTLRAALDRFYLQGSLFLDGTFVDVKLLPDNRLIAAGDGLVLWDPATGASPGRLVEFDGDPFSHVVVSPDGTRLIALKETPDWQAFAWSLDGATLSPLPLNLPANIYYMSEALFDNAQTPYILLVQNDGTCLLANGLTGDVQNYGLQNCYDGMFSPDGRWLAIQTDTELKMYPAAETEPVMSIPAGAAYFRLRQFAISPDSRQIAVGNPTTIELWDIAEGQQTRVLEGHTSDVNEIYFTADGETLISGSFDGTIRLWDLHSGVSWRTLPTPQLITLSLSATGQLISLHPENNNQTRIDFWQTSRDIPGAFHAGTGSIYNLDFSADSRYLAANSTTSVAVYDVNANTRIQERATGVDESGYPVQTALQPDGSYLALMSASTLSLLDILTGEERALTDWTLDQFGNMLFTPDGTRLVTIGSNDATIRVFDVTSGELTGAWHSDDSMALNGLAISPDSQTLLLETDENIAAWDVLTGDHRYVEADDMIGSDEPVAVLLHGRLQTDPAAGLPNDGEVRIYDTVTGETLVTLTNMPDTLFDISFNRDDSLMAVASGGRAVQVYDTHTGQIVRIYNGASTFYSVEFSPDSTWLAAGNDQGEVRVWHVRLEDTIAYACERLAGFDFNGFERARFELDDTPTCP